MRAHRLAVAPRQRSWAPPQRPSRALQSAFRAALDFYFVRVLYRAVRASRAWWNEALYSHDDYDWPVGLMLTGALTIAVIIALRVLP